MLRVEKKLREAEFFLSKAKEADGDARLESEEFDFYLSAFFAAARSVTLVWQHEDKPSYDSFAGPWWLARSANEQRLADFMNKERVDVIHRTGFGTRDREVEEVDLETYQNQRGEKRPGTVLIITALERGPRSQIMVARHYLAFDGKRILAVEVCARYLDLLRQLLADFGQRAVT